MSPANEVQGNGRRRRKCVGKQRTRTRHGVEGLNLGGREAWDLGQPGQKEHMVFQKEEPGEPRMGFAPSSIETREGVPFALA